MTNALLIKKTLQKKMAFRIVLALVVLGCIFFIPAGTFWYPQAWVYMAMLVVPSLFSMRYLLKHDPKLLERRMRMKEKEVQQQWIIGLSYPVFLGTLIIPGLDYRFGWSTVSYVVVGLADLSVLLGSLLLFFVLKENSYASRIIEVEKDQKVISTGPYAVVRHPMYAAVLLMYIWSPLALGSYWALIPSFMTIFVFIARILNEEKVLSEKLEGYKEYMQKTKYRLIPYIW